MLNFNNARTPEQLKKMLELKKNGVCLFCEKNKNITHGHPVELSGKHWSLVKNDFPYEGTKVHYLLIHKKHIKSVSEMSPKASEEMIILIQKISKKYSLPGLSFFMRSGDTNYTGSSIDHLHAHIISGSKFSKKSKPIMTTLSWKK